MASKTKRRTRFPPFPRSEHESPGPSIPTARGDFRTYETTLATLPGEYVFEARLTSSQGHAAHFAFDLEVAACVSAVLARGIAQYSARTYLSSPVLPEAATLEVSGTDVFFVAEESPTIRVEQESGGDRIVLMIRSAEASLHITMQFGVAIALQAFLSGR